MSNSPPRFDEAFAALAYLTQTGRIPPQETHDLLVRFDDKRAAVEGDQRCVHSRLRDALDLHGTRDAQLRRQADALRLAAAQCGRGAGAYDGEEHRRPRHPGR